MTHSCVTRHINQAIHRQVLGGFPYSVALEGFRVVWIFGFETIGVFDLGITVLYLHDITRKRRINDTNSSDKNVAGPEGFIPV